MIRNPNHSRLDYLSLIDSVFEDFPIEINVCEYWIKNIQCSDFFDLKVRSIVISYLFNVISVVPLM